MVVIIAKMKVKQGAGEGFEAVMGDLVDSVRKEEPGNLMYSLNISNDGDYIILEKYKDQDALMAHQKAPHFQASFPKLSEFLDGPPEIQFLKELY